MNTETSIPVMFLVVVSVSFLLCFMVSAHLLMGILRRILTELRIHNLCGVTYIDRAANFNQMEQDVFRDALIRTREIEH